eukprot:TRINITY_DN12300_c0_g1_i1.p1 TRINITY_DN12300_c0_g1~~TRINITY_DN12300_c0_g1_i1.p1  ORF type:complete len:337 (-),score=57.74 TRINITY_DN12300_c0_g1_i1:157-1167(-)
MNTSPSYKILKKSGTVNTTNASFPPKEVSGFMTSSNANDVSLGLLNFAALAYETQSSLKRIVRQWKYEDVSIVSSADATATICANRESIIIAIQSKPPSDCSYMQSLDDTLVPIGSETYDPSSADAAGVAGVLTGRVHQQHLRKTRALLPLIGACVSPLVQTRSRPVYITGHAVGGALCIILSALVVEQRLPWPIELIATFGQPRVGDAKFLSCVQRHLGAKIRRYVAGRDPVPRLPVGLFAEAPLGVCVHLDNGVTRDCGSSPSPSLLKVPREYHAASVVSYREVPTHTPLSLFAQLVSSVDDTQVEEYLRLHHYPSCYATALATGLEVQDAITS